MDLTVELVISGIKFFVALNQSVQAEWRWNGKVAVVTGASSGIGAEVALQLANKGMIVAAIARREHRLQELVQKARGNIHAVVCDLTDEKDIIKAFKWIESNLGGVDVLVNNAGTFMSVPLIDLDTNNYNTMFDLNVLGLAISSREALRTMKTRGDDGHIININSIAGHRVFHMKNVANGVYSATKFAVNAYSEALANELNDAGSKIKVASLSPGLVMTELITNSTSSIQGFENVITKMPHINVDDIAEGVIYVLSTKPTVHISELTIKQLGSVPSC